MTFRRWLVTPLVAISAVACSGSGAGDAEDTSTQDTADVAAADEDGTSSGAARDSIPMEVTVTTTGGTVQNNGTFAARGMGTRCTFEPDVPTGVTRAAWNATFLTEDTTGVQMFNLEVGTPVNDTTSTFALTLVAGTMTAGGMTTPMRYMVATWPTGSKLGSGTVTVKREGDGARFVVNAVDGSSKTRIAMTATCARLGRVD